MYLVESGTLCGYRHKWRSVCPVALGIQSCFAMVQTDLPRLLSYVSGIYTYFTFSAVIHSLHMLVHFRILPVSVKVSCLLRNTYVCRQIIVV